MVRGRRPAGGGAYLLAGQHDRLRGAARGAGLGVVAALAAKYTRPRDLQYLPDHDPGFDVVWAIRPRSAMAWRLDDYDASQRRWPPLW